MFDPLVEIGTNEDYFGERIQPRVFDDTIPDSQRYKPDVSPIAKGITDTLNTATGGNEFESGWWDWSPESVEHMAGFATGGVGRFFGDLTKTVETMASGEFPAMSKTPILKLFLGQDPKYTDVDAFYTIRDEVHKAKKERDAYPDDSARRLALERRKPRELSMVTTMKIAERRIDHYRDLFKSTQAWVNVDETVKRTELDRLNEQIAEEMRKVRLEWNTFAPQASP
jgi:hypothetical protein